MMFFKRNAPTIVDYDKTKSELLRLGWLVEIYDVETNKSIYDITDLGYQYYFAICMSVNHTHLFGGPTLTEGQTSAYIDDTIDLVEEGFIIDGIDCKKLTPKAAEYVYVLTDSHGKDATTKIKLNKKNNKNQMTDRNQKTNWWVKAGTGFAQFMKGMQSMSKAAQEYDKNETTATQNAWGKNKKSSSRKRTSASKRIARYNKRKSNIKKRRKKHTDTTKSEILGGFDFKGIGDKMMK
jgi:hypothetical protein